MSAEMSVAQRTQTEAEQEMIKRKWRETILARIRMLETVEGTWQEIRYKLRLDYIPMKAFRSSCWHLWKGDRDDMKPHIASWRPAMEHISDIEDRPYILRAI